MPSTIQIWTWYGSHSSSKIAICLEREVYATNDIWLTIYELQRFESPDEKNWWLIWCFCQPLRQKWAILLEETGEKGKGRNAMKEDPYSSQINLSLQLRKNLWIQTKETWRLTKTIYFIVIIPFKRKIDFLPATIQSWHACLEISDISNIWNLWPLEQKRLKQFYFLLLMSCGITIQA